MAATKNWCFWTVVLEKTLESPLDCKEIQPVHPKGDQSWVFIGGTDAEAETPVLWPPHAKSWLIGKDPDAGRDWGQEKKGMTEDEMFGWHHWLDGHGFGWTPGVGDGQGGLACCGSWGSKESDTTERLNWTEASLQALQRKTQASDVELHSPTPTVSCLLGVLIGCPHPTAPSWPQMPTASQWFWATWLKTANWTDSPSPSGMWTKKHGRNLAVQNGSWNWKSQVDECCAGWRDEEEGMMHQKRKLVSRKRRRWSV